MNNARSKAGMARQGKLKRHDGSEDQENAMAAKTSIKVSLPSLHDKPYPSLGLCVPQAILEDFTFAIAINNITFYYSTTLASVYASSTRRAVCIICRILALYSEKSRNDLRRPEIQNFLGVFPQTSLVHALCAHLCAAGTPPVNFCLRPCSITTNLCMCFIFWGQILSEHVESSLHMHIACGQHNVWSQFTWSSK